MLGIQDPTIALVYLLCIVSAILCLVWGIWHWNDAGEEDEPPEAYARWVQEEEKVEDEL